MSKAIEALQAAMQRAMAGPAEGGGFPVSVGDFAAGWRHAKPVVSPRLPEPVPYRAWPGRVPGHAAGGGGDRCSEVRP